MTNQSEALQLADCLEEDHENLPVSRSNIAYELRRLHAENQALNDALQYSMGCHREMSELAVRQRARLDELERLQPKREPLTSYEIYAAARERWVDDFVDFNEGVQFAESTHGIK